MSELDRDLLGPFYRDPAWRRVRSDLPALKASVIRVVDTVVAAVLLLLACPLFLAAAIATRRASGGSALTTHTRVGRAGETFQVFGFRSPTERPGRLPWWRSRAAALPQLLNVVRGDMSLIGPPAPRPDQLARALRVRPGIIAPRRDPAEDRPPRP